MFSAWAFAATSTWPGFTCPISMKASVSASSCTTVAGICFATILQKTQLGSCATLHLLIAGARHLEKLAVLEPQRRQRSPPYAAGVDGGQPGAQLQSQCGPVAAQDRRFVLRPQ